MTPNNMTKQIGQRLRQARINAGYKTILEFTDKQNTPKSTYTQYEIGARSLSIELAIKYAQLLKTNLVWLLTGKGQAEYSDDELIANIPEQLSEAEFLSIMQSKKKPPVTKYKASAKTVAPEDNISQLADILSKVLATYQIDTKHINLKHIAEIATGIYIDAKTNSTNNKEFQSIVDAATSTLSRTVSHKKHVA